MQLSDILTVYEAEHFIESLEGIEIKEFGSKKWVKQDEMLQKLNLQAHVNALMRSDEFIMDSCVTFDKVKMLIYDLIMSEMWMQFVFPLLKGHLSEIPTIRSYTAIQHQAVVCNLLQVCLYHRTAVEAADSYILEMIDYSYRKLAALISKPPPKKIEKKSIEYYKNRTKIEELEEQVRGAEFQIQMMCLSIIRFITDYIKYLPINVVHQVIVENDVFLLLVPLIEEKPWLRENIHGEREVFEQQKWVVLSRNEYSRLPKIEAQVWITIYNLYMDPESRRKYELTDFKKNNLLRLRKYMNEILLDQIPQLADMLRSLEELSLMPVQSISKSNLVVQQLPELRSGICKGQDWKEIAEYQKINYFKENDEQMKEDVKRLAKLYSNQIFEGLIDGFKCEKCGKEATKRCSRCKKIWYCSKECQVSHWATHKNECGKQEQPKEQSESQIQKAKISELDQID